MECERSVWKGEEERRKEVKREGNEKKWTRTQTQQGMRSRAEAAPRNRRQGRRGARARDAEVARHESEGTDEGVHRRRRRRRRRREGVAECCRREGARAASAACDAPLRLRTRASALSLCDGESACRRDEGARRMKASWAEESSESYAWREEGGLERDAREGRRTYVSR